MRCPFDPPRPGALLLAAVLGLSGLSRATAAAPEVRDYVAYIDGRRAGDYRITITDRDDGSVTMTGQARLSLGEPVVSYSYQGTEVWKGGRLLRLESRTEVNGRRYAVSAAADPDGLRVRVNDREGPRVAADAWVTTYWRLPAGEARERALTLLDADTGRVLSATLQYVGPSQVGVAGAVQNGSHYRLSAGAPVELWYDAAGRLVHQEWVEDHHKAMLDLRGVRR
jgi:hypothetical protein